MGKGSAELDSDMSRALVQQAYHITEGGASKWEFEACKNAPKPRQEMGIWLSRQGVSKRVLEVSSLERLFLAKLCYLIQVSA